MKTGPKPQPLTPRKTRILNRVAEVGTCWLWLGPVDSKGYGRTFFGSRHDGTRQSLKTHRVAYEEWVGPIPAGLTIDHLCGVTGCCNPEHLETVTNAENKRRGGDRMRACRQGHPRTSETVYIDPQGRRHCRICKREAAARLA